jgi:predicted TIM-barrel fold metal-dependent hydrolase
MKVIDYHHHILPGEVARLISRSEKSYPAWNPEESIEFLNKNKMKGAVLSLYHPELPVNDKQLWVDIVRTYNEAAAAAKKKYPDSLRAFAALPFPYIEESISEIHYALDELKLDGMCIYPIAGEKQLDNEDCLPILKELDERKVVVFLHPIDAGGIPIDNEHYLDSVLALTRFMYYNRFKSCSNIRFILAHTGGSIPFLAENMGILQYMQDKKKKMGKFLWDYLIKKRLDGDIIMKSMYIDTSDCFEEVSIQTQNSFFNPGHLLWGSDSSDAQKNIEILEKFTEVFQNTDLDLFS